MNVTIEPIHLHSDQRGFVFEPLWPGQLAAQKNTHVVLTEPGCVRGNHYHARGTEVLAVVGAWLIRYRDHETTQDLVLGEKDIVRLTIPPGVAHAFKYIANGSGLLVAFTDLDRDDALADITPALLIEP